jgi:hypothetical protein
MASNHVTEAVPTTDSTLFDAFIGGPTPRTGRRFIHRSGARAELRRLQSRLSLLAMQKDYWRQRCVELVDANGAAEAELAHLRRVLADSMGQPVLTK